MKWAKINNWQVKRRTETNKLHLYFLSKNSDIRKEYLIFENHWKIILKKR